MEWIYLNYFEVKLQETFCQTFINMSSGLVGDTNEKKLLMKDGGQQ